MGPKQQVAPQHLSHLKVSNYSPNTIYARSRAIHRFIKITGVDPVNADPIIVANWWANLDITPSSRTGELNHIRGYCRWAVKHGHIQADPTQLIDRPRSGRRVPRPIDEDSLQTALASAPNDTRLVLSLAAFCGLRACEISALEWGDIRQQTVLINGKGAKQRVVPLHPLAAEALNELRHSKRGRVLRRRDGQPGQVAPYLVSAWANRYLHEMGIPETLHQLRHRYATQVYQLSAGDIRLTQDLLGHSTPAMTALYAAWDQSQAAVVIARLPTPA